MKGKIIKALSGFYYVQSNETIFQCRGRGVFRKRNITPLVGDYVEFQAENEQEGYILSIEERKNELVRPPIANIDQAILVFSLVEPTFSPLLLDRFLVLMEEKYVTPIIVISKVDLGNIEQIKHYIEAYQKIGYTIIQTSSETNHGLSQLTPFLKGKISVIAGQSGVGKSSLLNALCPELELKTDQISTHLGRGKHTTRHVELINVADGLVADTPGFSQLDFSISETGLSDCFPEFRLLSEQCKFRGCSHIKEPSCAVKQAVENEEIAKHRYEHYLEFSQEIKGKRTY